LKRLDQWLARRREIAATYHAAFAELSGTILPNIRPGTEHAWHQYCLLVEDPDGLRAALDQAGIDSRVYYATPIHRQQVYASHPQHDQELPITDSIANRLVAIPVHHQLSDVEVQRIVEAVCESITA
jgi:dTDP-4-amino-4,6-dideoxygalactose transaminase